MPGLQGWGNGRVSSHGNATAIISLNLFTYANSRTPKSPYREDRTAPARSAISHPQHGYYQKTSLPFCKIQNDQSELVY